MDIIDEIRADREAGALRLEREYKPRLLAVAARFCSDKKEAEALFHKFPAEAEKLMCARLPERLHGAVHYFIWAWDKPLRPVRGMATLARELKEKGYRLYLLSNAASRQHEYWHDIPGSEYFEGSLISADHMLTKPDKAFYQLLLDTFSLKADECVFIDDAINNAEGAFLCGMHPIVFHNDVAELRAKLREEGVEV